MTFLGRNFVIAVALAISLITCSASAAVHQVTVQDFSFNPANITVAQGDTVVWTNVQGTHNVHHTGNPSLFGNSIGSGWTYTFVFNLPAARYDYVCQPHAPSMAGSVTVEALDVPQGPGAALAGAIQLAQNYPNPFNSSTVIEFSVPGATQAQLTILNVLGQEIARPFSGRVGAGTHRVTFDASALSAGLYFYRLQTPGATLIRTMQFVR